MGTQKIGYVNSSTLMCKYLHSHRADVFITVPDELDLGWLRAKGLGEGEEALPDDKPEGDSTVQAQAKEEIVQALEAMGFPRIRCQKAALATSNAGAEEAMNWLFAHMEDPDIDDPLPTSSQASSDASEEALALFESMGFTRSQARVALKATVRLPASQQSLISTKKKNKNCAG